MQSELSGAELNAEVARALGYAVINGELATWAVMGGNVVGYITGEWVPKFTPSTDWSQGGPIIEREGIDLEWAPNVGCAYYEPDGDTWQAYAPCPDGLRAKTGPTPLVAAMRAFVASRK